jgi:GNAT superfamily N-acetyltransferase
MRQPTYRQATPADHPVIVAMLCELVVELGPADNAARVKGLLPEDIRFALESASVRIFLAELDGWPVGHGRADVLTNDPIFRLRADHRCGYIDQMYVRPPHRDRGIGAHLLALCEDWFRELGIAHVLLHAAPKAVQFYSRAGYASNREMFKRL